MQICNLSLIQCQRKLNIYISDTSENMAASESANDTVLSIHNFRYQLLDALIHKLYIP